MFNLAHILRAAGLCSVALHTAMIGASAQQPPAELQKRVEWLTEHTSTIRSVDPADDDFSDLESIGRAIGTSRVVLLGEQSHGDGTVFLAKTRLIRYLHEKLGFDVVAFESGLYDTRVAWDSIRSRENPGTAFRRGVFGIWSRSEQLLPLIDYLGARAMTERPLELSGFDSQFTANREGDIPVSASRERFTMDLLGFLAGRGIDTSRIAAGTDARLVLDSLAANRWNRERKPTGPQQSGFFTAWTAVRQQVEAVHDASPDVALWKQLMKSVEFHARNTFAKDSLEAPGEWAIRDRQMAANLVWLAQERFKGRKIIVWAASVHNARSLYSVDTQRPAPGSFSYEGVVAMGEHVWQALGTDVYSIGFVASEGSFGGYRSEPRTLPPINPESLEGMWAQTGAQLAFVNFRGLRPDEWLRTRLISGPFGYTPMVADWTTVFDGMIFTRVMEKSRRAER